MSDNSTAGIADETPSEHDSSSTIGKLIELRIDQIVPDENQPRKDFGDIELLADSIKTSGQLEAIYVVQMENGKYKLINGERRWRALQKIAKTEHPDITVKAICVTDDDPLIGLIMNLAKKNYNAMEIANAYASTLDFYKGKLTQEGLAKKVGKSRINISEHLSLTKLPEKIQTRALVNSKIPFNKLKQLAASKGTDEEKIEKYKQLEKEYPADANKSKEDQAQGAGNVVKEPVESNKKTRRGKISVLTDSLNSTAKALENLDVDKIPDESIDAFATELDKVIASAQVLKGRLSDRKV